MNRMDFQNVWIAIVKKGFQSYETLTREERVWFNVEPITTDGIWDHYMNGGGAHNADLIEDFVYLGFPKIAKLFLQMNGLFPGRALGSVEEISACIAAWPDGKNDEIIDDINGRFWDISKSVDEALLNHIASNFSEKNT